MTAGNYSFSFDKRKLARQILLDKLCSDDEVVTVREYISLWNSVKIVDNICCVRWYS